MPTYIIIYIAASRFIYKANLLVLHYVLWMWPADLRAPSMSPCPILEFGDMLTTIGEARTALLSTLDLSALHDIYCLLLGTMGRLRLSVFVDQVEGVGSASVQKVLTAYTAQQ